MKTTPDDLLAIENYSLEYELHARRQRVLEGVTLSLRRGEILGLVGESGSGKSSLVYGIMRLLPSTARETGGAIRFAGMDLTHATPKQLRQVRGSRIGMVFQDPNASLNPNMTLGEQVSESLVRHKAMSWRSARAASEQYFARVGLKNPAGMLDRYPHEASGGEKQRAVIAGVLATEPDCILFDEPTTALDIITSRQILKLIRSLRSELGIAAIYISHDLALVSEVADRVAILEKGCIVEQGNCRDVLSRPQSEYTRNLLAKIPRPSRRLAPETLPCASGPLLAIEDLSVVHTGLRNFSLSIGRAEIVGLVGESGSGKSTIARALVGLNRFSGRLILDGRTVAAAVQMNPAYRGAVQIIFQHAAASLNPRKRVGDILRRPLRLFRKGEQLEEDAEIAAMLAQVGLPGSFARRYPHQLSGGQMQRVAIASVFLAHPKLIVCDEITSALDIASQASIIELLLQLRALTGVAILFITHDLNLVRQIADRIAVLYRGDLLEVSTPSSLGDEKSHHYTRALLEAVATL